MPRLKRKPENWNARQLQRQPPEHKPKCIEGLATMAVKRYMGKKVGNCHQLVKPEHVIEFIKTNPQIDPYLAIRNFGNFLVEGHVIIDASLKLGLNLGRTREEIGKGRKG